MSKYGNMNISRVTNEQMRISEILPQIRQPIKPMNTQGYGFEQVLRKEQEKLSWSNTYHREGEFYEEFYFDAEQFYKEDETVDEDALEKFVEDVDCQISEQGDFEFLGYDSDGATLRIDMKENADVTIVEYGRYEPPDVDYSLEGPEISIPGLKKVVVRGWN